jgi:hypothetical protein
VTIEESGYLRWQIKRMGKTLPRVRLRARTRVCSAATVSATKGTHISYSYKAGFRRLTVVASRQSGYWSRGVSLRSGSCWSEAGHWSVVNERVDEGLEGLEQA